ncbi:hypothetical protein SLOPH_462 [Spraguea lophii 42_110]|uniref:Uncharacterized protein n=1 Tax=Spraguea lophii (strain 42_110) TaxID=1358809 RepID=S7W6C5_SPRLO|nr:hypothetical protein SLOPH_462 [Spraguea lophii 42_110]
MKPSLLFMQIMFFILMILRLFYYMFLYKTCFTKVSGITQKISNGIFKRCCFGFMIECIVFIYSITFKSKAGLVIIVLANTFFTAIHFAKAIIVTYETQDKSKFTSKLIEGIIIASIQIIFNVYYFRIAGDSLSLRRKVGTDPIKRSKFILIRCI